MHMVNHRAAVARVNSTTRKTRSGDMILLIQSSTNVNLFKDEMQWQLLRYRCIVNKKNKWPRRKDYVRNRDYGHGDHTDNQKM